MKKVKGLCLIFSAIALAGCTSVPEHKFGKAGATEADFHRDKTQCEDEAFTAGNIFSLKYIEARNNCMVKRGWTQVNPK